MLSVTEVEQLDILELKNFASESVVDLLAVERVYLQLLVDYPLEHVHDGNSYLGIVLELRLGYRYKLSFTSGLSLTATPATACFLLLLLFLVLSRRLGTKARPNASSFT